MRAHFQTVNARNLDVLSQKVPTVNKENQAQLSGVPRHLSAQEWQGIIGGKTQEKVY
jgi:hypothetical protein